MECHQDEVLVLHNLIFFVRLVLDNKQTDFPIYVDHNKACASGDSIDKVIKSIDDDSLSLFKWSLDNPMKSSSDKRHLITNKESSMNQKIGNINNENSTCEKMPGIKVNYKLNFSKHLKGIGNKASRKIRPLFRIFPSMDLPTRHFFWLNIKLLSCFRLVRQKEPLITK